MLSEKVSPERVDALTAAPCAAATPTYFPLRALAIYSGLSVRTLRDHLHDPVHPLPYYHIGGKILVRRDEFDQWATQFRRVSHPMDLGAIVDDIVNSVR